MENRIHFLDNLRISAIFLLIFLHSAIIFTGWNWHISSKNDSEVFRIFCLFVHEWRMPLLFFISGTSSFLYLKKKTESEFIKDRSKRLLLPLFSGILILVPPQVYIEKIHNFTDYLSFYPLFFKGIYPEGNFFWHHLWFLGYLFLYSCLLYLLKKSNPFNIEYLNQKLNLLVDNTKIFTGIREISHLYMSVFVIFLLLIVQIILRPFFYSDTHALYNDWANFSHYFLFYLLGYFYSNLNLYDFFKNTIYKNLLLGILSFLLLFLYYYFKIEYDYNLKTSQIIVLRFLLKAMMGWFWISFFIGIFMKYFNFSNKILDELSIAVYPIYLIHQTIIVVLGYYILKMEISIFIQYLIICWVTICLSLFFYFVFLKKIPVVRPFFGIK